MALRARLHASHEPITRWPGGVARSLQCGTISNATKANAEGARTEVLKAPRGVGRPAFGRVNASSTNIVATPQNTHALWENVI